MYRLLGAKFATEDLNSTVRDHLQPISDLPNKHNRLTRAHLVGIHVALSTTPSLENHQGKVVNQLSRYDLRKKISQDHSKLG
jgi:hypothetical protein